MFATSRSEAAVAMNKLSPNEPCSATSAGPARAAPAKQRKTSTTASMPGVPPWRPWASFRLLDHDKRHSDKTSTPQYSTFGCAAAQWSAQGAAPPRAPARPPGCPCPAQGPSHQDAAKPAAPTASSACPMAASRRWVPCMRAEKCRISITVWTPSAQYHLALGSCPSSSAQARSIRSAEPTSLHTDLNKTPSELSFTLALRAFASATAQNAQKAPAAARAARPTRSGWLWARNAQKIQA
mmetsp:Transcript_76272/g.233388  ORF Transcript_76272/g.233388 Transcript_76272/m.233388 type:complete len:239 (-) Transcript_76272:336-1052(-)